MTSWFFHISSLVALGVRRYLTRLDTLLISLVFLPGCTNMMKDETKTRYLSFEYFMLARHAPSLFTLH